MAQQAPVLKLRMGAFFNVSENIFGVPAKYLIMHRSKGPLCGDVLLHPSTKSVAVYYE